jgi:hypothetical protein
MSTSCCDWAEWAPEYMDHVIKELRVAILLLQQGGMEVDVVEKLYDQIEYLQSYLNDWDNWLEPA